MSSSTRARSRGPKLRRTQRDEGVAIVDGQLSVPAPTPAQAAAALAAYDFGSYISDDVPANPIYLHTGLDVPPPSDEQIEVWMATADADRFVSTLVDPIELSEVVDQLHETSDISLA